MIFVYLVLFILLIPFAGNGFPMLSYGMLIVIGLGVLNLIILFLTSVLNDNSIEKHNQNELKQLKQEYEKKGLYEMTEQQLFNHECCEYDDYREPLTGRNA